MADKKITVVARIKAKEGMEEKMKQQLMTLLGPTRAEKGCINYTLHQSVQNRTIFMLYENWVSKNDLDEHMKTPHFKSHREKQAEMLAEPSDISIWEIIG